MSTLLHGLLLFLVTSFDVFPFIHLAAFSFIFLIFVTGTQLVQDLLDVLNL